MTFYLLLLYSEWLVRNRWKIQVNIWTQGLDSLAFPLRPEKLPHWGWEAAIVYVCVYNIGWLQTAPKLYPGPVEEARFYSKVCYCSSGILGSFYSTGQLGIPNITLVKIVTEISVFKLAWLMLDRWQCLKATFWEWVYESTPGTLCRRVCAKFTITLLLFFSFRVRCSLHLFAPWVHS